MKNILLSIVWWGLLLILIGGGICLLILIAKYKDWLMFAFAINLFTLYGLLIYRSYRGKGEDNEK